MLTIEYEYSYYLCHLCITYNREILDRYLKYNSRAKANVYQPVNHLDYELENYMVQIINQFEYWTDIKTFEDNTALLLSYPRLSELIVYIYNVINGIREYRLHIKATHTILPVLSDVQLEDSRLSGFHLDNESHTFSLNLVNVLLYSDRRYDMNIPVNVGNIEIVFRNTEKVQMRGLIYVEPELNVVSNHHTSRISNNKISFCILIYCGHNACILQIDCSDILIKVV